MKNYSAIFVVLLFTACSTCKVVKESPIQKIQFGYGGGFTGLVTSYELNADGSLLGQSKKITKLSCDSISAIFELAEQLPEQNYIRPGNMYSFVRIITKDKTLYYTWSWPNQPDNKVIELFNKLNTQL